MLLEDNKRDYVSDQQEETRKMSISADVESHIIRVLTEHSYDDPLGSSIREAVSNAVDSVTESQTGEPVIVSIKKNMSGKYELSIEDKGLGLDDVSFFKYIMGLGESTKRNNPLLLGGYGAGAKAWLAYTNNFSYICRKDGVERKYLIFKGEEYPEATLVYEQPTTEVNGVKITVALKDHYNEISLCKQKIKEQLSYLDNVYYDIEGFENTYNVFRSDNFQFSDMSVHKELHISLKDVYYEIDWNKIGLTAIRIPVAIRFDDYSQLKPIFNRESIQYNSASIQAIKQKIADVADWFVQKYNEGEQKFSNIVDAQKTVLSNTHNLVLFNNTFNLNEIKRFSSYEFKDAEVAGITLRNPHFYASLGDKLVDSFTCMAEDERGIWRTKHVQYTFKRQALRTKEEKVLYKTKLILVDYVLTGHIKAFLREKHRNAFYVTASPDFYYLKVKKTNYWSSENCLEQILKLSAYPRNEWRNYIEEFKGVIQQVVDYSFIDEREAINSEEFQAWVVKRKEDLKAGRIAPVGSYTALNKQKGDITIYEARLPKRGGESEVVYDKVKRKIEDLSKIQNLVVYTHNNDTFPKKWITLKGKVLFYKFNMSEIHHVTDLKNFITKEQYMESKPLARTATAFLIANLLEHEPDKIDNLGGHTNILNIKQELKEYKILNWLHCDEDLKEIIINDAKENNNFDESIMAKVNEYEKFIKAVGFLKAFKENRYHNQTEKAIVNNITYIMLKYQKITSTLIEDFELVKKPEPVVVEEVTEELFEESTEEGDAEEATFLTTLVREELVEDNFPF